MYENPKLCDRLKPSEVCLVVEQYAKGHFTQKFHEHVPRSRLSDDARAHLQRALIIHFSGLAAEAIVACHLNRRGQNPPADDHSLRMHISYPEPGVIRFYCGFDTHSWSDQVIAPGRFRQP